MAGCWLLVLRRLLVMAWRRMAHPWLLIMLRPPNWRNVGDDAVGPGMDKAIELN
jgi:hypothetical protein